MLATKAAICVCGQLIFLCIGFMLASESENSLHQGHEEEERDSTHLLCLIWGILCGRRDDLTVVDSKTIEVKCESKLCSFWHTFLNKKNSAAFHNKLQSSSVKIPNKHSGLSYQEWRITNSTKKKILTKNLNNSSVSNRMKFNRVGVPYRVSDSLTYYFNTHFASRTLKEHPIDDSLNKATNFFNTHEKYAKEHVIDADTYENVASMKNDTNLMFNTPKSNNFNENVISLTLNKHNFSKKQLSYADEEIDTMSKLGSVNGSAIHNSAFNAQINFTDTQPFSKIYATTSKSDDGTTKSNLLISSSEINLPRFPKAFYTNSSNAENNKTVLFGANADDFQQNSSSNSPNNTSLNEIAFRREGTLGNNTNLQKENTFVLTTKLNEDSSRNKNAPELGVLENSKKLNDSYSLFTTETETVVTKEENPYATESYDFSSTRIRNKSLKNSILSEIKSDENIPNIKSHENNIKELNKTNILLNKPERRSVLTNKDNTAFHFISATSHLNENITLTVPSEITTTKQSSLFQSDLLKHLFTTVSANVSPDSDQEKLSQNAKFSTIDTSEINSDTETMYPANNVFTGLFTLSKPSSQNRKDTKFQMTNIENSVANENQSFTSAYEDFQKDSMNGKHDEIRKSENEQFERENHDGKLANNLTFSNGQHGFAYSTEESKSSLSKDDQNNERKNVWIPTNSDLSMPNKNKENSPHYYLSTSFDIEEFAITSSNSEPSSFAVNKAESNALHLQKDMIKTTSSTKMEFSISSAKDEIESNTANYKSSTPLESVEFTGISLKTKLIGDAKIEVETDAASLLEGLRKTTAAPKMVSASFVTKLTDSSRTASKAIVLDTIENFSEKNLNISRNDINLRVKANENALEAEFGDSSTPKSITYMKNAGNSDTTLDNKEINTSNPFKEMRGAITSSKVFHGTENTTINSLFNLSSTFESKELTERMRSEMDDTIDESFSGTDNSKTITQHQSTITANELSKHSIELSKTTLQPHLSEEKKNPTENSEEHSKITGWFQSTVETNYVVEDFEEPTKKVAEPQSTVKTSHLTEDYTETSGWSQLTNEARNHITKDSKETTKIIEKSKPKTNPLTENSKEFSDPTEWFQLTKEFITEDAKVSYKTVAFPQSTTETNDPKDDVEERMKTTEKSETAFEIKYSAEYSTDESKTDMMPKTAFEANHPLKDTETPKTVVFPPSTTEIHYLTEETKIHSSVETTVDAFSSDITNYEEIIEDILPLTNEIPPEISESPWEAGYLTSKENFIKQPDTKETTIIHSTEGKTIDSLPEALNPVNNPTNLPINFSNDLLQTFKTPISQKESNTHKQGDPEIFSNTEMDFLTTYTNTGTLPSSNMLTKILISSREKAKRNSKDQGFPHRLIPDESIKPLYINEGRVTTTTESEFTTQKWHKWGRTVPRFEDATTFTTEPNDFTNGFKTPATVYSPLSMKEMMDEMKNSTAYRGSNDLLNGLTSSTTVPLRDLINWKFLPTTEAEDGRKGLIDRVTIPTSPTTVSLGLSLRDLIHWKFHPTTEAKVELNGLINGLTSPTTVSSGLSPEDLIKEKFDPTPQPEKNVSPFVEGKTVVIQGIPSAIPEDSFGKGRHRVNQGFHTPRPQKNNSPTLTIPTTVSSGLSPEDLIKEKFDPTPQPEKNVSPFGEGKTVVIQGIPNALPEDSFGEGRHRVNQGFRTPRPQKNNSPTLTIPTTVSSGLSPGYLIKDKFDPTTEAKGGLDDFINELTSPKRLSSGLSPEDLINENFYTTKETKGGLNDLINELTSPTTEAKSGLNDLINRLTSPATEFKGGLNDLINGLTSPTTEAKGGMNDLINGLANPTTETKGGLNYLINELTSPTTQTSGLSLNEMIVQKYDRETTSAKITIEEGENKFVPRVTNDVSLIRTERDTERTLDKDYFSNNANSDSDIIRTERELSSFDNGKFGSNQGFGTSQPEENVSHFEEGRFVVNQGMPTAVHENPLVEGRLRVNQGMPTVIPEDPFGEGRLRVNQGMPTAITEDPFGEGRLRVNQGFPTARPQKNNSPSLTRPTTVASGLSPGDLIKDKFDPTTEAKGGLGDFINEFTSPTRVSSGLPPGDLINENFYTTKEAKGGLNDLINGLTSPTTETKGGLNDLNHGLTSPTTEAIGGLNDLINGLTIPITEAKGGMNDFINGLTSPITQTSGLSLNVMIAQKYDTETTSARITIEEGEDKFLPRVTNDVSLIRTERDTERTLDNDYFTNNANSDSDIIRTERELSSFGDGQFGSNQGFGTFQPETNVGEGQLVVNQGLPTALPEDSFGEGRLGVNQGFRTPRPQKNNSPVEENQFGVKQGFGTPRNPERDGDMINFRTGNSGATGNANFGGKSDINGDSNTDLENNPKPNLSGNFGFGKKDFENSNLGKDMTTPSFPSGKWLPFTAIPNFDSNSEVDVEYKDFDVNPLSRRTKVPGGKQMTTSFALETTSPFDGSVSQNPTNEPQSGSTSTQESNDSSQSTVATTEGSIIPFHFTIDADYDEVVGSRKTKFEENLTKQLAVAMRVPLDCVQNMQVKKGSIEVNFDLVPNSDHGHLADEKALKAAADELKRMIDNGQLTISDLDGNTLVVVPLDPPTDPPPASNMEHTTLILGVVIGAFILTVITVAIAAIVYKRKSSGDHRLSPIEEARSKLPSYREIPFQEALFMKGSGRPKVMMGKYCYNTGQWLGPGPEPKLFQAPESVVYRPPTDSEIRRTPRPPTAVRERLKYDWEVDWDSMVCSR